MLQANSSDSLTQWELDEKMNQFVESIENDLDNIAKADKEAQILSVSQRNETPMPAWSWVVSQQ